MHRIVVAAIAAGALVTPRTSTGQQPSLAGKWAIAIGTPENPEFRTLDAAVAADGAISGTIGSPNGAVSIQSGRMNGARFSLEAVLGTGIRLSYDGIVSNDTIRGTWRYDKYDGAFVGLRGTVPPRVVAAAAARSTEVALDAALRAATIDSLFRELAGRYVDTSLVPKIVAAIRERLRSGAYDTLVTSAAFARVLTADLRRFDKHLAVMPVRSGNGVALPGTAARDNFGIKRVERLDGNVGYLKLDVFSVDPSATDVLRSALRFLARTDALIIDLRENRGGSGLLEALLLSHLDVGPVRAAADRFMRTPRGFDSTAVMTAERIDPAAQYGNRPVYVLTSPRTASAAEWLAYNLQSVRRAKIVGEVTAGAAHPIGFFRLNTAFDASIAIGRVRSRITHTDFEGVGVQPDRAVTAERAFDAAYGELLETLLARATDPLAKAELERAVAKQKSVG